MEPGRSIEGIRLQGFRLQILHRRLALDAEVSLYRRDECWVLYRGETQIEHPSIEAVEADVEDSLQQQQRVEERQAVQPLLPPDPQQLVAGDQEIAGELIGLLLVISSRIVPLVVRSEEVGVEDEVA